MQNSISEPVTTVANGIDQGDLLCHSTLERFIQTDNIVLLVQPDFINGFASYNLEFDNAPSYYVRNMTANQWTDEAERLAYNVFQASEYHPEIVKEERAYDMLMSFLYRYGSTLRNYAFDDCKILAPRLLEVVDNSLNIDCLVPIAGPGYDEKLYFRALGKVSGVLERMQIHIRPGAFTDLIPHYLVNCLPYLKHLSRCQSNFSPKRTTSSPPNIRGRKPKKERHDLADSNCNKLKRDRSNSRSVSRDFKYKIEPQSFFAPKISADPEILRIADKFAGSIDKIADFVQGQDSVEAKKAFSAFLNTTSEEPTEETKTYFKRLRNLFFSDIIDDEVVKKAVKTSIAVAIAATGIFHFYNRTENSRNAFMACCGFGIGYFSTSAIIDILQKMDVTPVSPQMDFCDVDTVVSSLITLMVGSTIHSDGYSVKSALKGLGDFNRVKTSLSSIIKTCLEILQGAVNSFRSFFLKKGPYRFMNTGSHDIDEFLKMVDEISNEWDSKTFYFTAANIGRLKRAEDIGTRLCRELVNHDPFKDMARVVTTALNLIKECKKKAIAANPGFEGMRQEPVGVLLIGGPGVGKSLALEHISNAIAATCLKEEEREVFRIKPYQFSHNRQFENDHWDGITAQNKIVYYDDIGQNRTVAGTPNNEWMEIVRALNSFPYLCHMAALEGKGNTFFHAEFVLCTTNDQNLTNESVKDQEAVQRRFHLPYMVFPKDEFALNPHDGIMQRRIDVTKLPNGCEDIASMHPSNLLFGKYDFKKKSIFGIVSFEDVIQEIISFHALQKKRFDQYKSEVDATFNHYATLNPQSNFDLQLEDLSIEEEVNFGYHESEMVDEFIHHLAEVLKDSKHDDYGEFSAKIYYQDHYIRKIGSDQFGILGTLALHASLGNKYLLKFNKLSPSDFEEYLFSLCRTSILRPVAIVPRNKISIFVDYMKEKFHEFLAYFQEFLLTTAIPSLEIVMKSLWDNLPMVTACLTLFGVGFKLVGGVEALKRGQKHIYDRIWRESYDTNRNLGTQFDDIAERIDQLNDEQKVLVKALLEPEAQSITSGHKTANNKTIVARTAVQIRDSLRSQGGDINGESLADSIVNSNCWEFNVQIDPEGNTVSMGYILFVSGRVALLPYHFVKKFAFQLEHGRITLDYVVRVKKREKELLFTIGDILANFNADILEENDLCLVEFPKKMQPCRNIVKNFATANDCSNMQTYDFILMGDVKKKIVGRASPQHTPWPVEDSDIEKYWIQHSYRYHASTVVGDCGKPLFIHNRASPNAKIFGMHTCGIASMSIGWSSAIIREDLIVALNHFGPQIDDQSIDRPVENLVVAQGQFSPLYRMKGPATNNQSKIIRSRVVSTWGDTKLAPAKLRPFTHEGVRYDPMINALSRYCTPDVIYPSDIVQSVCESIYDNLMYKSTKDFSRRILTLDEAVQGIPGIFKGIPRNTSPGVPYTLIPGKKKKGKTAYFGEGQSYDFTSEEYALFKERVDLIDANLKKGVRMLHIYTDFPKDETRPIAKVNVGATRGISGSAQCYVAEFRRYFGSFMIWIVQNRVDNNFANGVNPYSEEWDAIARKLNCFGVDLDNIGDMDYKGFDGSQKPQLHHAILLFVVQRWYGDDCYLERETLFLEMSNSRHILFDILYEWLSSLPSGHPFTIFMNCLINEFYLRFAWVMLRGGVRFLSEYESNVSPIFQGDDNNYAVNAAYVKLFTGYNIGETLLKYGVTCTAGDKGALRPKLRKLTEVDFLKRGYRFCEIERRYVAPIDLDVIRELPLWTKKGNDSDVIVETNVKSALQELALHGQEKFDQLAPKIVKAFFEAYGIYPEHQSFYPNYVAALHRADEY